jgi:hypothetical protein
MDWWFINVDSGKILKMCSHHDTPGKKSGGGTIDRSGYWLPGTFSMSCYFAVMFYIPVIAKGCQKGVKTAPARHS